MITLTKSKIDKHEAFLHHKSGGKRIHFINKIIISDNPIENCDLSNSNFNGSVFLDINFSNVNFGNSSIRRARFDNCHFDNVRFDNSDLTESYFYLDQTSASFATFSRATLKYANFHRCFFSMSDFSCAMLHYSTFVDGAFRQSNFANAKLLCANFSNSNLEESNFTYADLTGSNFFNSNLIKSDFKNAIIIGANFSHAEFPDANNKEYIDSVTTILPEGELILWKKLYGGAIAKLRVPAGVKRSNFGRKCRVQKAYVEEIRYGDIKKEYGKSSFDYNFIYRVGHYVSVDNFDENRYAECSSGIHCFITRYEAEKYGI